MALVAWAPTKISAPIELIAVRVPAGKVTEREWWEALADRVTRLARMEPPEETTRACRILGLPETDEPMEAGQYLVLGNLNLRTHLTLAAEPKAFPLEAQPNPEAKEALEVTDLQTWVELARSTVNVSDLA